MRQTGSGLWKMIIRNEGIEESVRKRGCIFVPVILLGFAFSSVGNVFTDLIVYRTCLVSLKYNATECFMLRTNASSPEAVDLETKVEPYASMIVMARSLMDSLLPGMLSLFLGPWSDREGRRPLLLAGFAGYMLSYFSLSFMSDWDISPWYLLLGSIPANIVGGISTAMLACICYVTDITAEEERIVQLTLIEASLSGGELLGSFIGPSICVNFGYTNVFRTATVSCATALAYIYFFIPESVENTTKKSLRGLFKISLVKDLIISSSVKRDGFRRSVVWLGIATFTLNSMISGGHATIAFLFTRVRLGWNVQYHSYYIVTGIVLRITGLCGVSLFGSVLGFSDTSLAGIGFASILGGAITKSLSWKSWHMYFSVCIEIFCGIVGPVTRSIISKSVPAQDVGKVLSLTAFLEASSPLAGAPLYTQIFSHYLPPIYPSPVFLLSTTFCILSIIFVSFISILLRKSSKLPTHVAGSRDDET